MLGVQGAARAPCGSLQDKALLWGPGWRSPRKLHDFSDSEGFDNHFKRDTSESQSSN
ncbi:hypothetical protein DPMN_129717 [Dreissena polymorpha]|uniref:Uncharacterized protein n=1 Tax=Dreissena polymorpha TaxID=45954 RepID=A0A9D4H593_DREPO|nr:hypothetical protein DPMN_129717 [Dreissena polymorpha]